MCLQTVDNELDLQCKEVDSPKPHDFYVYTVGVATLIILGISSCFICQLGYMARQREILTSEQLPPQLTPTACLPCWVYVWPKRAALWPLLDLFQSKHHVKDIDMLDVSRWINVRWHLGLQFPLSSKHVFNNVVRVQLVEPRWDLVYKGAGAEEHILHA